MQETFGNFVHFNNFFKRFCKNLTMDFPLFNGQFLLQIGFSTVFYQNRNRLHIAIAGH